MVRLSAKARAEEQARLTELQTERQRRRDRFRILVCLNGTEPSYDGIKIAADIGRGDDCDIILLYVRRIDQGLNSGGLQVRVARQNMLDWGIDLPGITYLKTGLAKLIDQGELAEKWKSMSSHTDVFGDPLGDNKIEYRSPSGKSIVLKLKIAVDVTTGILDQYELGPYNLIITGPPKRWRGEFSSFLEPSTVQKVAMLAPCSVLTNRGSSGGKGHLICFDGTEAALDSVRRAAILADHCRQPITLLSVARTNDDVPHVKERLSEAVSELRETGLKVSRTMVPVGDPVREIIAAGEKAQLIVVADSGKSRLKRFLVGSVAFDVMGSATTSVLNVR